VLPLPGSRHLVLIVDRHLIGKRWKLADRGRGNELQASVDL
jgi:hypothetical protein